MVYVSNHFHCRWCISVWLFTQIQLQIILFLLFWDVLWIINDLLAPLSLFFHEFQQNSQFLRTISNDPDLGRVAYNHEYTQMLYFYFPYLSLLAQPVNILVYYTLRFYFPYLSLLAQPVNILVYWPVNIIQLLHLNEINMRFHGAEYNNIERGEAKLSSILLYSAP